MISNAKYKIAAVAKDLGMKSADLTAILKAHSIDGKAHANIDEDDFAIIFEELTQANQVKGITDYMAGKVDVAPEHRPVKEKKADKPAKAEIKPAAKPEAKPETKPEIKQEAKPEIKAPAEKKQPVKEPVKQEVKPERPAAEPVKQEQKKDKKKQRDIPAPASKPQNQMERFQRKIEATKTGIGKEGAKDQQQERKKDERRTITVSGGSRSDSVPQQTGKRIIDMGSSDVNMGKYDEKLDKFADTGRDRDNSSDRQKIKKKNNQEIQQGKKGQKVKTEKEKEFERKEKKKREVFENAKNAQLKVSVPDAITVGELASRFKVTASEVVKRLMKMGMMLTVNDVVDYDTAYLIGDDLGIAVSKEVVVTIEEKLFDDTEDKQEDLVERAPVVCVMGHVDHGKTSLLDAIRHTNVTTGEAGGITQHIGAYSVSIDGREITFLDTPGHEAFTAMRLRGAKSTDIAIIVVAADDGIMPQTVEAINHAKAAGVSIIIAINKMDKPHANPDQVKQELAKYELIPEEWGGDTICVPVSALTRMGIEDLLENVLLVADVKELKANPNRQAKGVIIESRLDKGKGPVATVLVQNGTLHSGDVVIAGTAVGRVRVMTNDRGKSVKTAGPSVPVEIMGLSEVPTAGDEFSAVADEKMARELADMRRAKEKEEALNKRTRATLEDIMASERDGIKELKLIVKADVAGSSEAVCNALGRLVNEEVRVRIIHSAVGGVTEGDVMLAATSDAIIIGFNVTADRAARDSAKDQNVEIRTYTVIYSCIEDVEAAMKGMLAPKYRENIIGHAEVRQTIKVPNVGVIAGSYILDGKVTRHSLIRVLRDSYIIFEDKVASLRRFKDDVKEVNTGYECGIGLDKFDDIHTGDILEAYVMEEIKR